jgi:long-subunit fatty acid transport protein
LGNAFRLFKGLSFGFNLSYLFGSQNTTRIAEFAEPDSYFLNSIVEENNRINGFYISAGLQYFIKLKENHTLGLGVVYENSVYMGTRQTLLARHYLMSSDGMHSDTVKSIDKGKGAMRIPQSVGGGLSYNFKDKIIVGFDATWQNWTNYKMNGEKDSTLRDALLFSAGLQFTPDPTSGKFSKRISLRIGAKYSTGYFSVKGVTISEYAICAGISLPIRTFNTNASLNIMLEYGQMGTLKNDLIRQDVFKISFNFTLHERWYQRTKLD